MILEHNIILAFAGPLWLGVLGNLTSALGCITIE